MPNIALGYCERIIEYEQMGGNDDFQWRHLDLGK